MICSSMEKDWLFLSSSQAAVTDTTSGLMLFNCSSNCSLNRMAWSLGNNRFTPDICRQEKKVRVSPWEWDLFLVHLFPYRLRVLVVHEGDLMHTVVSLFKQYILCEVSGLCQTHGNSLSISMPHLSLCLFSLLCCSEHPHQQKMERPCFRHKAFYFVCISSHHNAKLLRLCQVVIFVLHLTQDIELLLIWQLLDQILGGNKWQRHLQQWETYKASRITRLSGYSNLYSHLNPVMKITLSFYFNFSN